ncbi:MAG: hypothetical protein KAS75_06090 [Planctomycetes bacterium]|nr:hypothetical protein [Planctomycetota bacterium]
MDCVTILAESAKNADKTSHMMEGTEVPIDLIWQNITSLNVVEALTFISFGAVCLFYGWRVFKILVIISFALLGLVLGMIVSEKINGGGGQLVGGLVGLALMSFLAVPLMRWAVCILGGLAGGILTAGAWYALELNEGYIWAGALIGIIAGGMISFIIFRVAVMLFSSMGGGILMVVGVLALLYLYPETSEQVESIVFEQKWFLPLALLIPTAMGIIVQNKFIKGSKDWRV